MSSAQLPPKTNNGSLNSVFNASDFVPQTEAKYDAKYDKTYLKLTGGSLSGGLTTTNLTVSTGGTITSPAGTINGLLTANNITVATGGTINTPSITTNGITSSSGINQFDTNITLPTTYSVSPNLDFPTNNQLGGFLTTNATPVAAATGVVAVIASLAINPGVWMVCWRGSIYPTATGSTTYNNIRMSMTTSNGIINHLSDVQQRVSIASSQSCTFNATNGYDVSLMGSTIVRPTATTTYYLNGASAFTGVASNWRGHIHAVRIA